VQKKKRKENTMRRRERIYKTATDGRVRTASYNG